MPSAPKNRNAAARFAAVVVALVVALMPSRSVVAQALAERAAVSASISVDAATLADSSKTSKTFFTKRDAVLSGMVLGGSAILSIFDVRIAHWMQSPSVQDGDSRKDLADALTTFNEQPLAIITVGGYAIGKLSHSELLADVAGHSAEALVLSVLISEAIRVPLGRARPRVSPDDQYNFEFMKGWTEFDRRSFPSIHAAAAYSVASALVGEIKIRNPGAVKYAAPLLYTAAAIPGITRMYLNQHWASDVLAGTFVGVLMGSKVVSYAHSHHNKVDRVLGIASLAPDGRGGTMLVLNTTPESLGRMAKMLVR